MNLKYILLVQYHCVCLGELSRVFMGSVYVLYACACCFSCTQYIVLPFHTLYSNNVLYKSNGLKNTLNQFLDVHRRRLLMLLFLFAVRRSTVFNWSAQNFVYIDFSLQCLDLFFFRNFRSGVMYVGAI